MIILDVPRPVQSNLLGNLPGAQSANYPKKKKSLSSQFETT